MRYCICLMILCTTASLLHGQWETAQQFTKTGTATLANTWSVSSSFGGMVHIVWCDTQDINSQLYYRRSSDGGKTWDESVRFIETVSNAENPGVAIAGVMSPVVHVVWDDDRDGNKEIYYKRSSDWGVTWSADTKLTESSGASIKPNLHGCVCCGADVRIVWIEEKNGKADIFFKYSGDNGLTWSDNIQITDDEFEQDHPNLSFCRADVQIVWTDFRNGKPEIWGRHSTDCGTTWDPEMLLSDAAHPWAGFASIAHFDSTYHIAWIAQQDPAEKPCYDIFYTRAEDLGITWEPIRHITDLKTEYLPFLSAAAMGSNLHLVWGLYGQGLFYMRSKDNGATWESATGLVLNADVGNPALAVAGKCLHIVWHEKNEGKTDIFYMHDPTGNPVDFSE